jgi:hypothetical protein
MTDIILDDSMDLKIVNGDFVTGYSDEQQQNLLLLCNKGSFKEMPNVCVGIENYLESEEPVKLIAEIKRQFAGDGMTIKNIEITSGKLLIDAGYGN